MDVAKAALREPGRGQMQSIVEAAREMMRQDIAAKRQRIHGVRTGEREKSQRPGPSADQEATLETFQEPLAIEITDVDLATALSNIAGILDGLDPDLFDLSELGLGEVLIDISVLPDAGPAVDLGFDQVDLGQQPAGNPRP
jgi:hypothetical protein